MFPIKNLAPQERFAFITYFIILLNIAVFVYCNYYLTSTLYLVDFGLVPSKLGMPFDIIPLYDMLYPFITYQFIHSGYFHLIFNIYFLFIFGGPIESRLGHRRFLFLYVAFGIMAAIVQVLSNTSSGIPVVGASGAIAGVMGASLVFYPNSKIKTLFIIIIFIMIRNIPAFIFIGFWFLIQLLSIYISYGFADLEVAFYAHLGGFFTGVIIALIIRIRQRVTNKTQISYDD